MRYCSVLNCNTDQTYKIRFHSFPKDEKLRKSWSNFTERPGFWTPGKTFLKQMYVSGRKLSYYVVPFLHPPHHPHCFADFIRSENKQKQTHVLVGSTVFGEWKFTIGQKLLQYENEYAIGQT